MNAHSQVSILVFLDGALKASFLVNHLPSHQVSILVFLDGALKVSNIPEVSVMTIVSILVFLDGALKGWITETPVSGYNGFNPCFSGWRSESFQGGA